MKMWKGNGLAHHWCSVSISFPSSSKQQRWMPNSPSAWNLSTSLFCNQPEKTLLLRVTWIISPKVRCAIERNLIIGVVALHTHRLWWLHKEFWDGVPCCRILITTELGLSVSFFSNAGLGRVLLNRVGDSWACEWRGGREAWSSPTRTSVQCAPNLGSSFWKLQV